MTPLEQFLHRAEALLARVEAVLPPAVPREPVPGDPVDGTPGRL